MSLAYTDLYIFIGMILSAVIISAIYRVYIIKSWIKHYCKYDLRSSFPEAASIPQEGPIPITRTIDFTWEPSLWFKNYDERAVVVTGAAIDAYKEYDNFYNLFEGKILLDLSIKAVKKSCFNHGLMCTNYVTPRWGGEISITFVDKPVEKPVQKLTEIYHSEEVPRIRQIMVCKNV